MSLGKNRVTLTIVFSLILTTSPEAWAQSRAGEAQEAQVNQDLPTRSEPLKPYFARLVYYGDTRGNSTLSIFYGTRNLPLGFEVFGFTDFDSEQDKDQRYDLARFFTELRLTRLFLTPVGSVGAQTEYNDANGSDNQMLRFGLVYRPRLDWTPKGWFFPETPQVTLRVHPLQTNGKRGQLSVIWFTKLFHSRLIAEGFADYNIDWQSGGREVWVVEPQLRFMVTRHFGLVYEYRHNGFYRGGKRDSTGHALGLVLEF